MVERSGLRRRRLFLEAGDDRGVRGISAVEDVQNLQVVQAVQIVRNRTRGSGAILQDLNLFYGLESQAHVVGVPGAVRVLQTRPKGFPHLVKEFLTLRFGDSLGERLCEYFQPAVNIAGLLSRARN
jgi:hypothetical protein